jgi:hypothetical protein
VAEAITFGSKKASQRNDKGQGPEPVDVGPQAILKAGAPETLEREEDCEMPTNTAKGVPIETEVIAQLPLTVDLAKLNSQNDLRFTVKSRGELLGTLQIGRGSVRWFRVNAKKATGKWTWRTFAKLLGGY